MKRDATSLTIACALVLISEKVRFWSDDVRGIDGKMYSPRCFDAERAADLRESLIAIADHCQSGLKAYDKTTRSEQNEAH